MFWGAGGEAVVFALVLRKARKGGGCGGDAHCEEKEGGGNDTDLPRRLRGWPAIMRLPAVSLVEGSRRRGKGDAWVRRMGRREIRMRVNAPWRAIPAAPDDGDLLVGGGRKGGMGGMGFP